MSVWVKKKNKGCVLDEHTALFEHSAPLVMHLNFAIQENSTLNQSILVPPFITSHAWVLHSIEPHE